MVCVLFPQRNAVLIASRRMDEFCSDVTPFLLFLPIRQLRHIYVQHFGKVRQLADIKLYTPFHNRESLLPPGNARL